MNKAPAGNLDSQLVVREQLKAPQLDVGPTREGVRTALEHKSLLAGHPDATTVSRMLSAPRVVSSGVLSQIRNIAGNFTRPLALAATLAACGSSERVIQVPVQIVSDGGVAIAPANSPVVTIDQPAPTSDEGMGWQGWLTLILCSGIILAPLAAFATTLRLGKASAKAWKLMERSGLGGALGLPPEVKVYTGRTFLYSTFFRGELAEVAKVSGNFPDQQREIAVARGKLGKEGETASMDTLMKAALRLGFSPSFDSYAQPVEINGSPIFFTWSVNTDIVDPVKSHIYFDPSGDYALQSRKINDEIQPMVAEIVSSYKFTSMDEATSKRGEIATKLNNHPLLKTFQDKYGIKLVIKLADIASPDELQHAATRKLVELKNLETDEIAVKRAEKKGEADIKTAEARAKAIEIVGLKENEIFGQKIEAANKASSPIVGASAFVASELRGPLADLTSAIRDAKKLDAGSK